MLSSDTFKLKAVPEWKLNKEQRSSLQELLANCFPDYLSNRIYYKQLPQFRILAWENEKLVAQVGVEHRMIKGDSYPVRIFGVIDLCCAPEFRSQGIAAKLLEHLHGQSVSYGVDFVVLFADDHRLYEREGFVRVKNKCKWLGIDEHKTVGIIEDNLSDCMMVKAVGVAIWPPGEIDMLGYLF